MEFYTKAFFVVLAALVAYGLLMVLQPFAGSMAWAIFLAFLLYPAHVWLTRKFGNRAGWSAGLLTGLTPFALLIPLTFLGSVFASQARALVAFIQEKDFKLDGTTLAQLEQYPVIGPVARVAREQLSVSAADIQEWLTNSAQAIFKNVATMSGGVVLSALGTLVGFFFMLFLLFFFVRDGKSMFNRLQRLIPVPEEHREQLFNHLASVTRGVFYGIGLTAIFQGILVGIGFAIASMPSPVVFGVLAGILALLPAGGAAIVWIPAVLYLAAIGHWGMFIFLLIWGVIVSTSDNFLRPILVARYAPVSAFMVFVGVVGGIAAFGTIGIVVGPVFLALVAAILEYFDEKVIAPNKRSLDAQADDERPPPMPGL
ncbi:MAG TPA: AI-2E family transporter [Steroidobacteraceae bacterium]|jgi:predicted PurR-regulated permease PerM|nr:AI-2E family transporter [Steroidobacteraceae bacterium]